MFISEPPHPRARGFPRLGGAKPRTVPTLRRDWCWGKLFIVFGICFLAFGAFLLWERNTPQRLSFRPFAQQTVNATAEVMPVRLIVPSQGINLSIYPASINQNKWEDTKQGVSFLTSSPVPGTVGNSIIYGHNWPNLLGPLTKVKPGELVVVAFNDGTTMPFIVTFTSTVTPDQTHVLEATDDKRLTIYTCTGFFDSKRFVVTAIKT